MWPLSSPLISATYDVLRTGAHLQRLTLAAAESIPASVQAMKAACQLHDRVNLAVLPLLSTTSILGVLGVISCQVGGCCLKPAGWPVEWNCLALR